MYRAERVDSSLSLSSLASSSSSSDDDDLVETLPYNVSVGRLHAFDVVPRLVVGDDGEAREDSEFHEREEGLIFAERFGIGVSLYFKIGKLFVFILVLMGIFQLPALVWYADRGRNLFKFGRKSKEQMWAFPKRVALMSGIGGATLARLSMAAVKMNYHIQSGQFVAVLSAFATILILAFASSAGKLVNRDLRAMRALAPRPEHYAIMLRDLDPSTTAIKLKNALIQDIKNKQIVRLAVHHVIRPRLQKAVETMALEQAARRNFYRSHRFTFFKSLFQLNAQHLQRQRSILSTQLGKIAQFRGPATVAFVIFDTPKAARSALQRLRDQNSSIPNLCWRRVSAAPSPLDLIWENLEVGKSQRFLRRLLVRSFALALTFAGALAAFSLRGEALDDWSPDYLYNNTTTASNTSITPYLRRGPRRHGLVLVLIVVVMNAILRFVVRRGSVFEAHSARSTEQSSAVTVYFMATTINTLACYALAAWRQASKAECGTEATQIWYAEVASYFLTTLLWEALAPPAGAFGRFFARKIFGLDERRARLIKDGTSVPVFSLSTLKQRILSAQKSSLVVPTPTTGRKKKRISEATPLFSATLAPPCAIKNTTGTTSNGVDRNKNKPHRSEPSLLSLASSSLQKESSRKFKSSIRSSKMNDKKGLLTLIANYLAAPNWDATARSADILRVFFLGAVFSAGQPLMPWLAANCLVAMVAHDKWALLRDRRLPPHLGPHLARTVVALAPFAAPCHAILAIWSWSGADNNARVLHCSFHILQQFCQAITTVTLPNAIALILCPATFMLPALFSRLKKRAHHHHRPHRRGRRASPVYRNRDLPWREARTYFERKNIPYLYDIYDDNRPLERSRHPDFFRHWSVLDNMTDDEDILDDHFSRRSVSADNGRNHERHDLANSVLQVFNPPRGFSDSWIGCRPVSRSVDMSLHSSTDEFLFDQEEEYLRTFNRASRTSSSYPKMATSESNYLY